MSGKSTSMKPEDAAPTVFISHHSKDTDLAKEFANLLMRASVGALVPFYSTNVKEEGGIAFGAEWYRAVLQNIEAATDLVAILTPDSTQRPWILYEAGIAVGLERPVIGLLFGLSPDDLPGPFRNFQTCAYDDEARLIKLMIQIIRRVPSLNPNEENLRPHVARFLQDVQGYMKDRPRAPRINGREDVRTLHYVSPIEPASDFFNRFYGVLSTHLSMRQDMDIHYHSTNFDPCNRVASLLHEIPETDAVMVVPKSLHEMEHSITELHRALEKNPKRRLIFVDRTPPSELITRHENTSFVGINNRRAGTLAGFALFHALRELKRKIVYVVVNGPGGDDRSAGCVDVIKALDPEADFEAIRVKDLPGNDTRDKVHLEQQRLTNRYPDHAIGIFAGNDETARAICHYVLKHESNAFRIVGCDATREMREWVDTWPDIAYATIYNRLYTVDTINAILRGMSERVLLSLDPELHPSAFQSPALSNPKVMQLWKEAEWRE